jgi:CRP/FNR family transcriptional regulator, cyclic AMP receptor protein
MSIETHDVPMPGVSRWPEPSAQSHVVGPPHLYAYLLDADDDLAQELDVRMRFAARQLTTARVLDMGPGQCDLGSWLTAVGQGPGLLILDGLVAVDTRIVDRTVTELVGTGDLLQPACRWVDDMVEQVASWRALCPTRFALLDTEFAERARPWPQIDKALVRRTERRAGNLSVLRAISCQPRLELRLVLLLWHLAARWGRVEPAGLRLSLPLTHRLLGQLVAAERPSISHALGRLAQAGLVTGTASDLHLHGSLDANVESLIEHAARQAPRRHRQRSARQRIA